MARYIGDYEVLSELGAGHYGTVYRAAGMTPARGRNPAKRRLVAIKKLKDTAGAGSVDLLLQEFALLDQVKHRGIVRVFEYLEDEHAVVMEHIHGVTLRRVLEELDTAHEQVFTEAAVEIGCELADALYQAYTTPGDNGEPLQLVHRDLKPANVMLTPQGEVKILDFGLARVDNADFAQDDRSRVKGTPIYMAPEQARGLEIDHRTDLFALGLILYELLMGEAAYRVPKSSSDPVADVFAAIEAGDLASQCRELETMLPAHGPIVTRLLQRRPEDRYQNGHDALVDLRRQLYRDRGSYLTEFCEFFFGTICDIGPAPQIGAVQGGSARPPGRGRRLSIEERLRQSMAREDKASSTVRGNSAGKASRPASVPGTDPSGFRRNASPPSGRTPAASRVSPPVLPPAVPSADRSGRSDKSRLPPPPFSGVSMSTNRSGGSGRRPARPPVGGGASRAEPFKPAGGRKGPLKTVGQRSPDETGMLEMVPLSADSDRSEAGADPSATAFFAIPAPKADRSRPAGGGPPSGSPLGGGTGASPAGPPPAPGRGFGGPPPPPGGSFTPSAPAGAMARPGNLGPSTPQQQSIQGPVVGYGAPQAGGATPFVVAGPTPGAAPPADADSRVQSARLYAILFACFVLVSVAIVVAVWLRPGGGSSDGDAVADNATTAPNTAVVDGIKKKAEPADTGVVDPPPKPTQPRHHSSSKGQTTPAVAPKPPSNPGAITVRLGDPNGFSSMTVLCPSGFRAKGTFSGGSATVGGVPAGQSCSLIFNGGISPGRFSGAQAGRTFTCSMIGSGMVCK